MFEPTGPFHRLFEATLVAAGIEAVKGNPRSARRFAEATGELAKTDRIDAAIRARMGAALDLEGRPLKSETLHDLIELGVARQALVKDASPPPTASNRQQIVVNPVIKRQLRARLKQIGTQLKETDAAMVAQDDGDTGLSRRRDVLASIPGIGTVTAMAILIEMPELGTLDNKQAATLLKQFRQKVDGFCAARTGRIPALLWPNCSIPDDHIAPRRSAFFVARSVLRRVSDLLCMSNLSHASILKEHDNNDDFQGSSRRAA